MWCFGKVTDAFNSFPVREVLRGGLRGMVGYDLPAFYQASEPTSYSDSKGPEIYSKILRTYMGVFECIRAHYSTDLAYDPLIRNL